MKRVLLFLFAFLQKEINFVILKPFIVGKSEESILKPKTNP